MHMKPNVLIFSINSFIKPRKYLLHFLAYFLLVVLLPFDHCHAATDRTGKSPCHRACNITTHDVIKNESSFGLYEPECHAHHRHHIRFLIDSEDVVLKSPPAGEFLPSFFPYVLKAIMEPPAFSDAAAMKVEPDSSANPIKYHPFTFSGLSPPCI